MDALDLILIHQLLGQYGHLVDAEEWDRFDELFTDDAVLDYTGVRAPEVLHGRPAIQDFFRSANHPSAHHVTNIVVTEEEGEVRVHSKFFAPFTRPSHDPKRWYGGDYHDVVVRTDDGWRFARRACAARWLLTPELADDAGLPEHRRTW
jgi:3-phenylpropionate/cinnamic acid dioxygenase small subunit